MQTDFLGDTTTALDNIDRSARRLFDSLDDTEFNRKPSKKGWSVGQCFEHLIKINELYLQLLKASVAKRDSRKDGPERAIRHSLFERYFIWMLEPPARIKLPAPPSVTGDGQFLDPLLTRARYFEGHDELRQFMMSARAVDIQRTKVSSPFGSWLRWSMAAALDIMMAHERRHLRQAARTLKKEGVL